MVEETKPSYKLKELVARGCFGEVYRAIGPDGGAVAIKKVKQSSQYKNREAEIMKYLKHPNIIELRYAFFTEDTGGTRYLHLVMDYMPVTLIEILREYRSKDETLSMRKVKILSYQLLRSLAYIHLYNICHRDIKPHNILMNRDTYELKLCDFGSAKILREIDANVSYIVSRYYRAPELIFGSKHYSNKIDIWAAGCIIAEMITGRVMFNGKNSADQLIEIMKILGTPTREDIKDMNPRFKSFQFPCVRAVHLSEILDKPVSDFLMKFFVYSPGKRITAAEAMKDPFFDDIKSHPFPDWLEDERNLYPSGYFDS